MYRNLFRDDLISIILNSNDLVFFVGSAISMFPPTNLPNGKELNLNIFKGLTYNDSYLSKFDKSFEDLLNANRDSGFNPLL